MIAISKLVEGVICSKVKCPFFSLPPDSRSSVVAAPLGAPCLLGLQLSLQNITGDAVF